MMMPTLSKVFATALAEVCTVPNRAIMLTTISRPSWKKLFSQALGTPILRILLIILPSAWQMAPHFRQSSCLGLAARSRMTTAATHRETTVGTATPATPIFSTKMQMALPTTLMPFIKRLTCMDTLLLPTLRNIAAPALYRAMNGKESAVICR